MSVDDRLRMSAATQAVVSVAVERWQGATRSSTAFADEVAVESPLEVRVGDESLATTMRTPGHDEALVAGLLWAEGLLSSPNQLLGVETQPSPAHTLGAGDVAVATLAGDVDRSAWQRAKRGSLTSASCGVCGRGAIDDLVAALVPVLPLPSLDIAMLARLPEALREHQTVFTKTGGLHAAAVVDVTGAVLSAHEDVGRHNAVDKAIGQLVLQARVPAPGHILIVSGRTSFEIVQKAIRAGVSAVVGVSAPSSLAVELATAFRLVLIGFARNGDCNLYTRP